MPNTTMHRFSNPVCSLDTRMTILQLLTLTLSTRYGFVGTPYPSRFKIVPASADCT